MDFASHIYVDDYAYRKYKKIAKIINKKKRYIEQSFYAVVLNEYTSKLEFEDWLFLMQRHYEKRPPLIVGLAKDYDYAEWLCAHMIKDCIDKTGSLDYISYLAMIDCEEETSEEKPQLIRISGGILNDVIS